MFALIPMSIINEKEKKDDDLEEAQGVLGGFLDLVLDELPQGLPLMREI
jgi:hypothetical protein